MLLTRGRCLNFGDRKQVRDFYLNWKFSKDITWHQWQRPHLTAQYPNNPSKTPSFVKTATASPVQFETWETCTLSHWGCQCWGFPLCKLPSRNRVSTCLKCFTAHLHIEMVFKRQIPEMKAGRDLWQCPTATGKVRDCVSPTGFCSERILREAVMPRVHKHTTARYKRKWVYWQILTNLIIV